MTQTYNPNDFSSFSILHVEDEPLQRQIMESLLAPRAREFHSAANGEEGLDLFLKEKPDLIITDVTMPRMNGLDMVAEIRRSSKETPIIVTTVLDDAESLFDAINLGVDRYVIKPIETEKLFRALTDCLEVFYARQRIEEQNLELQRLIAERDEFLGMAAHDLRNPVAAIDGLTELLLMDCTSADQQDILGRIRGQTDFMIRLLNDLLDLKRIEAGHVSLNCKDRDLQIVLAESVRHIQPIADQHAVRIICNAGNTPLFANYDSDRIRQLLGNLLSNALKFAPAGSTVYIDAHADADTVAIIVKDEGPGIPEGDLSKIFSKFETTPDKNGKKGTGLGLAISQRIATEHGGTLTAKNNPAGGAHFTLTLPVVTQTKKVTDPGGTGGNTPVRDQPQIVKTTDAGGTGGNTPTPHQS